jgi:hypothetical protein
MGFDYGPGDYRLVADKVALGQIPSSPEDYFGFFDNIAPSASLQSS